MERREFLYLTGAAFAALGGAAVASQVGSGQGYGALVADPAGLLDLPQGFSYRVISRLGDRMDDGLLVPDNADGMGAFAVAGGLLALVRNHELRPTESGGGELAKGFDRTASGKVLPGGTTTIVLDPQTLEVRRQYRSLAGTIRNCAGGTTPWGSWLTCEESVTRAGDGVQNDHGWVFEVPAEAGSLVDAEPLRSLGRFNHEAAAVDPATGVVYMTEDRDDGLLYRFIPNAPGKLAEGGKLQALAVGDGPADSRNWKNDLRWPVGRWADVRWIDLEDVESPEDDLRHRGAAAGATLFARGEGIHMGSGELYFCCTSGGLERIGQVFRLELGRSARQRLQLFFESSDKNRFNSGDNLVVAPNGHLIVCEDQYTARVDNYLRGITRSGEPYPLARLRWQTELAGACFSPDGKVLFVNIFSPATTVAITGPWMD